MASVPVHTPLAYEPGRGALGIARQVRSSGSNANPSVTGAQSSLPASHPPQARSSEPAQTRLMPSRTVGGLGSLVHPLPRVRNACLAGLGGPGSPPEDPISCQARKPAITAARIARGAEDAIRRAFTDGSPMPDERPTRRPRPDRVVADAARGRSFLRAGRGAQPTRRGRSEEHTSELQ